MIDQGDTDPKTELPARIDPISELDRHVLTLIQQGDRDTWNDFVASYHSRLLAFALRQVDQTATAEDVVQETFVSFLKTLDRFQQDCEIETILFQILRRRIVDHYRSKGRIIEIHACECAEELGDTKALVMATRTSPADPTQQLERLEDSAVNERTLSHAIRVVCARLRTKKKFRDLKIAEGTLYASLSNPSLAAHLQCPPNEVAVVKHRLIARLAAVVRDTDGRNEKYATKLREDLLAVVWERLRPSCPKRTTLGKYVLGLLPDDWRSYVQFHTQHLGCRFCVANLDELSAGEPDETESISSRIFKSTIGFLRDSSP